MATVKVMYWKDIPCTVRAQAGRRQRVSRELPEIYMKTIDSVAMRLGLIGSDEYQAAFRWGEPEERPVSPDEAADAVVAELLEKYPEEWLLNRRKQLT